MADEKTPEQLEEERRKLMAEMEAEETGAEPVTPTVRLSPDPPKRPVRKEPDFNAPRKFKDVTPKNNTVLIVAVIALILAVIGVMIYNYRKNKANV